MAWSGTVMADVGWTESVPRVAANVMPAVTRAMTGTAAATRRAVVPARTMRTMGTPRCTSPPPLAVCSGQRGTYPKVTPPDPRQSKERFVRLGAKVTFTRSRTNRSFDSGGGGSAEGGDHVVDRLRQLRDVLGVDGREHRDAQLVAAELAVGLDVDDAVGAQRRWRPLRRRSSRRGRWCRRPASGRPGRRRRGSSSSSARPSRRAGSRSPWCGRWPSRGRRCRASSRSWALSRASVLSDGVL